MGTEAYFPRVKPADEEDNRASLSTAEVKNTRSSTSTHNSTLRYCENKRDIFTFNKFYVAELYLRRQKFLS
jgi:hypothetical protein